MNDIDMQAAQWVAKLDGGDLPPKHQAELEAWMAEDTRHFGAYLRARALLLRAERHGALIRNVDNKAVPVRSGRIGRRVLLAGGLAACAAAMLLFFNINNDQVRTFSYSTAVGENKTVALPDGSQMVLNTNTRIDVRYDRQARAISLLHGEALFDVRKNKMLPFMVTARHWQIRDVGTSFAVTNLQNRPLQVLVREGVVNLRNLTHKDSPVLALSAGKQAEIAGSTQIAIRSLSATEVSGALAWRDGMISLRHQTLQEAATEFARYSTTRIILTDPSIATLTITGSYRATDPVGFAKAAALSLGLRVATGANEVFISRKK